MNTYFESYIRGVEPNKKEKASVWKTAIGLQAVDGLQTSDYLKDTAVKHIEGDINIDEVKQLINAYYQSKISHTPEDDETNELKNKYMLIAPPQEWIHEQSRRTTIEQAPDKYPTSTRYAPDMLPTSSPAILNLMKALGEQQLSIKQMLSALGLKDRENFMNNYLSPAIKEGFIVMLYPENPKHPRQKYLLTIKGLAVFNANRKSL